jgi:8-oxo-dGTP pyrophosphatase MutT (NUDIX family)
MPTRLEISCGGIVGRRNPTGALEVALIATHGGERWALPKGLIRKGESLEQAALREVREEAGLEAAIIAPFEPIEYWFWWGPAGCKTRHRKQVHYFLMRYLSGDTADHDSEVDEARWFPLDEAVKRASYKSEQQLLRQLSEQGGAGF